jgi:hypothetical protein
MNIQLLLKGCLTAHKKKKGCLTICQLEIWHDNPITVLIFNCWVCTHFYISSCYNKNVIILLKWDAFFSIKVHALANVILNNSFFLKRNRFYRMDVPRNKSHKKWTMFHLVSGFWTTNFPQYTCDSPCVAGESYSYIKYHLSLKNRTRIRLYSAFVIKLHQSI